MKVAVLFLLIFMLIYVTKCEKKNSTDFQIWEDFKIEYARRYGTPEEEQKRMDIFMENLRVIKKHNKKFKKGNATYKLGVNNFADKTWEEFKAKYYDSSCSIPLPLKLQKTIPVGRIPRSIADRRQQVPEYKNWVAEGAVTRVKNQNANGRTCGSCWTFAATGVIESHQRIATGHLVELSEQNLLDCTGRIVYDGKIFTNDCNGGHNYFGLRYVQYNDGIDTEQSYPYEAVQKTCRYTDRYRGARIKNVLQVSAGNENEMKRYVGLLGPITASVRFEKDMINIKRGSGVYSNPNCGKNPKTSFNHGVLVVGYGVDNVRGRNIPYWLIKNSWGPEWADDGYLKLLRFTNQCGIAEDNLYPELYL